MKSELNISMICVVGADVEQNVSEEEWVQSQNNETPSISGSQAVACRVGSTAPGIYSKRHPKSEITKIKML